MGLVSLKSNLAINGTPQRYDTNGKLGDLPEGASNLDFDSPVPAPVDNFPNTNANGFTIQAPVGVTQFVNDGQTSKLGWTGATPPTYDFFSSPFPSEGQEKLTTHGFPGTLPAPVDFILDRNAGGFTIQTPIGVTQFINDGQTSKLGLLTIPQKYDTTGKLINLPANASNLDIDGNATGVDWITNANALGFTIKAPVGVTQFVNNGQTSRLGWTGTTPPVYDFLSGINPSEGQEKVTSYGFPGPLPKPADWIGNTNAVGFTIQNPIGVSQFVNKGQTSQLGFTSPLPSGVDFIANNNANGFTIKAPIGVSQFVNNGQTSIYGFTSPLPAGVDNFPNINASGFTIQNPVGVSQFINNGQTSKYGFPGALPSGVDFIANNNAKGFTIQNPIGISQFVNKGQTSVYGFNSPLPSPVDNFPNINAKGFTIQNPIGVSQFINKGQTSQLGFISPLPSGVDFIANTNAVGFTIKNPVGVSQFINNGQTSIYGFNSPLPSGVDFIANTNAVGFTIQAPIGVSQFINNGQTSIYGFPGPLPAPADNFLNTNANGFTIQNPIGVSQFVNDGQTSIYGFPGSLPAPVDFILNTNAGGFTIQNPIGVSQFINDGQTSIYGFPGALPAPVDFILNTNAGGFTIQAPIGVTQFINDGQTSIYGFPGSLPAPVDNFLNTNANGFTIQNPIGVSQFINDGQTSIYGFPGSLPSPVDFIANNNAKGFTLQNPIGKSQFKGINIGSLSYINPTGNNLINTNQGLGVDFIPNYDARGFTIKMFKTQFKGINTNSLTYNTTSKYGNVQNNPAGSVGSDWLANNNAGGFIIKNPVGVSQFVGVDDANGVYNNTSLYGNIQNQPAGGIGSDWLANNHAYGFTIRMASSNFVAGGQTSIYGFWNPLPTTPANWLNDQNATGFTMKNPVGITQFVGADTANGIYINPTGNNLINTTPGLGSTDWLNNKAQINFVIKQRRLASNFVGISQDYTTYNNPTGNRIGVWNGWQDDRSGATGFKPRLDPYESNFIGISADNTKYQYPVTVKGARLLNVAMGSSLGTAKLENQLGAGSKMGNKGFYAENRYSEAVRNDSNQSLLASWSLRRRSPSPLEQQYSKFKIRDEAFNPTYIKHPLILRGIQNPNVLNPQRWGIDALGQQEGRTAANNLAAALDGGFIRGGASTALERAAIDTARIAKFMASPKGLVWAITQVGLGKSNIRPHGSMGYDEIARATQNPLPLLNNTQTHLGLTSLLSVPGSAFGLHFTRHGIPFLNESANYEYVLKRFTQSEIDTPGVMLHKHLRLKDELLDKEEPNAVGIGSPISNLSYTGGPQSVYGLGSTTIRRATDTLEGWKRYRPKHTPDPIKMQEVPTDDLPIEDIGSVAAQYSAKQAQDAIDANAAAAKTNAENAALQAKYDALEKEFNPKYGIKKQYSPELNLTKTGQGTIDEDKNNAKQLSNKLDNFKNIDDPEKMIGLSKKLSEAVKYDKWTPGNSKLSNNDPSPNLNKVSSNNINTISANQWNVLPYQELRKIAKERNSKTRDINDFRSSTNNNGKNSPLSTNPEIANYKTANIRDRYGYGEHGKLDQDRSNPYQKKDSSGKLVGNIDDTIEKLKTDPKALANDKENFRGDRINAIDFQKKTTKDQIYTNDAKDFIKFYFSDIDFFSSTGDEAIVFRASIKGLADTFQPGWSNIQVMGRPDGPALYSSFERNIGFNFTVAATSREELVPMWRKLNYLASYTMPIYGGGGKPGGVMCRMTIGDMFNNTPGFFTGLTISVNDEATWDLADDIDVTSNTYKKFNKGSKQLPNLVDVDVQFRILHDWRPQKNGRVYHLYEGNNTPKKTLINKKTKTSWLWDVEI